MLWNWPALLLAGASMELGLALHVASWLGEGSMSAMSGFH